MWGQVADDVRTLGALAAHMRRRRFAGGALRLDNVKLVFRLGADGNPAAAEPHVQREANQLVEVRGFPTRVQGLQPICESHSRRATSRWRRGFPDLVVADTLKVRASKERQTLLEKPQARSTRVSGGA